jgi:hypothetical protein
MQKHFSLTPLIKYVMKISKIISRQLKNIKCAVVSIAYYEKASKKNTFLGSGFFIKEGLVISTREILVLCDIIAMRKQQMYLRDFDIIAYHSDPNSEKIYPEIVEFNQIKATFPFGRSKNSPTDENYGHLAILNPKKSDNRPFLEINEKNEIKIFDRIFLCGYPSGEQTMDLLAKFKGVRFSPVLQFGQVTGMMPTDETPLPVGMQTDIVTGIGSFGSPILDAKNGKVVGIANGLIKTDISGYIFYKFFKDGKREINKLKFDGQANLGCIHGIMLDEHRQSLIDVKRDIDKEIHHHSVYYISRSDVELSNLKIGI